MNLRTVWRASVPVLVTAAACGPTFAIGDQDVSTLPTLSQTLTLKQALAVALSHNVTLRQSHADAAVATATAHSAQAQTLPSLSATLYGSVGDSSNILMTSPGVTPQNLGSVPSQGFADQNLMLMVPLTTGGRLGAGVSARQQEGQAAAQSVLAVRLTVEETVTESYAQALLRQSLVAVAQARLAAEDEQVRVTQERVGAGRSAPVDLLREQAEDADARQSVLETEAGASLALVDMKTALGVSQVSTLTLSDTLDGLITDSPALPSSLDESLRQASGHRPELAAADARVQASRADVRGARGAYAPQVYGMAMGDVSARHDLGRAGYTIGLTASLPLYDAGERRAELDGAKAHLDRAQADAQGVRQDVEHEVAAAWLTWQTAAAQIGVAGTGVTAAQQGYDLATLRYNAGKSVTSERLDALAALVRAQGALAQAKAGLLVARAKLASAVGGH